MSLPRYKRIKDSNIEWLGDVPEHWKISRLGFESWVRARLGWKGLKAEEYVDDGYIFLATPNIKGSEIDFENVNYISEFRYEESPEIKLRVGDVLLAKDGSTLGTVNVVRSLPRPATVNGSIAVITPKPTLSGSFLYYLFQSSYMEHTIQRIRGGMGVPHLFQEDLNKFYVPLPLLGEQQNISSFLDHETAKVDALIAEQQRLIDLMKQKRQSVISHAVTKGLDPSVPKKESGIEWLGRVPRHCEVKAMRNVASVVRGASPRPAGDPLYFGGDAVPWVTVAEITKDELIDLTETETFLTEEGAKQSSRFGKGTLIYSNSGATLGVPKILGIDVCANDGVVAFERLTPTVHPHFLYHFLASITDAIREKVKQGSGQPNLNTDIVKALRFALPPMDEQKLIVKYIAELSDQFRSLTAQAQLGISLLQERRTALISAAVTGKIDVRSLTAVQPEEVAAE